MKAIILAAGSGTRLKELTQNTPKCLVKVNRKPLIEYQLETLRSNNFSDICIVGGYKYKKINYPKVKFFLNEKYASTNMVYTLFCAREVLEKDEDVIISYGDIIYRNDILQKLICSKEEMNLTIDLNWESYWKQRMHNPLEDAETLIIDKDYNILELGKKPKSYSEINGQYMGLVKIRADTAKNLFKIWSNMDTKKIYDGKDFKNMYMTTFIQYLINIGINVKAVPIKGGWAEVDTPEDIIIAEKRLFKSDEFL
tara:strand:+ start:126 stop:887 length:762 start_codon:yes stop_codon:yes gene_type:complete